MELAMKLSEKLGTMTYHTRTLAELLEALYAKANQDEMSSYDRAMIEVALKLANKDLEMVND